jgi:SsrA-binding protein
MSDKPTIAIKNRKASYEFHLLESFTAGLVLKGTEVKSIREGKASLQEAYCVFDNGELYVIQMNITPYKQASYYNHEPTRRRKLLLNKKELEKLETKGIDKGLTIVPTRLFISKRGLAKLNIALARGKKLYDKRESLKKKDTERALKNMKF